VELSNYANQKLQQIEREIQRGLKKQPKFVRKDFIFFCYGECSKLVKTPRALKFAYRFEFCGECGKKYFEEKESARKPLED
jgi:hypothetical protein